MDIRQNDIQYIKGVGEKKARLFNKLGIFVVDDLLNFFPRKYEDWSKTQTVKESENSSPVCIRATMVTPVHEHMIRRGMTIYKCDFTDGETIIHVTLFNNKYLAQKLHTYEDYLLIGKIEKNLTTAQMSAPKIEPADKASKIHPVYPATGSLNSKAIEKVLKYALENIGELPETLPEEIRERYGLISYDSAIRQIHFPDSFEMLKKAKKRLIFEELLVLSLGLMKLKGRKKHKTNQIMANDFTAEFAKALPFELTNAQKRSISQCAEDLMSGYPMNRLLQGDVGSGKTAVAAALMYSMVKNGYQCALMAPTEILAAQHFETLNKFFKDTDIKTVLLTGAVKAKEKREIKSALIDHTADIAVGTHALIQNDVEFENLGLVITDEQHRFGVQQRADLAMKGSEVNTLVMSATPIPRTLGMIIYGDLDISVLDELPPGRQEIRTDVVTSEYHSRIFRFLRAAIERGEQGYIICPLVDEGENEMKAASAYAEKLSQTELYGYNLGLLHGKMTPKQKDNVMKAFARGDVQVLVATTVVEVGVDVPNATIMIIENAERFGLSQLHQLRGRIGRGNKKSYCILVSDSKGDTAKKRLMTMKHCSDGFDIADEDLRQRGPGDFFGKRQHGLPELKIADMLEDTATLRLTRQCAEEILSDDPRLDKDENKPLAEKINIMFRRSYNT